MDTSMEGGTIRRFIDVDENGDDDDNVVDDSSVVEERDDDDDDEKEEEESDGFGDRSCCVGRKKASAHPVVVIW